MAENGSFFNVYTSKEKIGLAIFSGCIFTVAVPVNIFVLFSYLRLSRRKPSDLLQMNMTLSQLLTALVPIPLQLLTHVMRPSLVVDGGSLCRVVGILPYPFYIVTIETMIFMSVDRLYAVKSPLKYGLKVTTKRISYILLFTWAHATIFTIIITVLMEFGYNRTRGDCAIVGENEMVALAVIGVTHVTIPFVLLVVFYYKLMSFLRRHNRQMFQAAASQTVQEGHRRNMVNQAQELKVACMVFCIITIYLISWIPPIVTVILQYAQEYTPPIAFALAVLILHVNEAAYPVLNLIFMKNLRDKIRRFCLCRVETSLTDITTSSDGQNQETAFNIPNTQRCS